MTAYRKRDGVRLFIDGKESPFESVEFDLKDHECQTQYVTGVASTFMYSGEITCEISDEDYRSLVAFARSVTPVLPPISCRKQALDEARYAFRNRKFRMCVPARWFPVFARETLRLQRARDRPYA